MTTVARLLARRQDLIDRLQQDLGPHEIERLIAQIDAALEPAARAGTGPT